MMALMRLFHVISRLMRHIRFRRRQRVILAADIMLMNAAICRQALQR